MNKPYQSIPDTVKDFSNQTVALKADLYDEFKDDSGVVWAPLPGSVIGTLLYFLKVEQNTPNFDVISTLKAIFLIGFPTYVTYVVQFLFVFGILQGIYQIGPDDKNAIGDSICDISPNLLIAAIFTYAVSMVPTYTEIMRSIDIVFNAKRVAYTAAASADEGTVFITNLLAPLSKRMVIFCFVSLIEVILVILLTICGIGYILSSDDVDDVLMNSLSVVFIMTIDDMACQAFQTDTITGHISSLEFETTTKIDEGHDVSQDGKIRPPSYDTYKTLWSIDQCIVTLIVTYSIVYGNIYWYC